jgi:hypothetical protein
MQFNKYCTDYLEKNAYLTFVEEFEDSHPRTCGNSIMKRWRKVFTEAERDTYRQRVLHEETMQREMDNLDVVISESTGAGMPDAGEKDRDLHHEWCDQNPLRPELTYQCVKVLYDRLPKSDEDEFETIVLLYLGFDDIEGRARDVSDLCYSCDCFTDQPLLQRFVLKRIRTREQIKVKELRRAYTTLDELPDIPAILKNRFWVISKEEEADGTPSSDPVYEVRSYMDYTVQAAHCKMFLTATTQPHGQRTTLSKSMTKI